MDDEKYILTTEELVAWKNEIQDVKKLEQEEREIAIKLNGSLPKIENKKFNSHNLTLATNRNLSTSNILKFGDSSGINNSMQKKIIKIYILNYFRILKDFAEIFKSKSRFFYSSMPLTPRSKKCSLRYPT